MATLHLAIAYEEAEAKSRGSDGGKQRLPIESDVSMRIKCSDGSVLCSSRPLVGSAANGKSSYAAFPKAILKTSDIDLARLATRVGRHLLETGRVLTTAESCTGGWIAKVVTDIAGSSQWMSEGFVTYSNAAKVRALDVRPAVLKASGAVSERVARAMATGALQRSGAQLAVAVTGIAGPGGAVPRKPVGTVWLAWGVQRGSRIHLTTELRLFRGNREAVRRKTVRAALEGLLIR